MIAAYEYRIQVTIERAGELEMNDEFPDSETVRAMVNETALPLHLVKKIKNTSYILMLGVLQKPKEKTE